MSLRAFYKTTCPQCGVHIEYPDEAEGQVAPCPKCGCNVLLNNQRKPAVTATANPNDEWPLIGKIVFVIAAGIIVAFAIGVACLVASKMGWNGLGSFMSYGRFRILDLGIWMLTIPAFIPIIFLLQKKKNQTSKDAIKEGILASCFTIGLISCFLLTFQFFYSTPQQNQTTSNPAALTPQDLKSKAES